MNQYLETIRHQDEIWKAGYRAAQSHRTLTLIGIAATFVIAARRHFHLFLVIPWAMAVIIAFVPVIVVVSAYEVIHRYRVRGALRAPRRYEPFEDE